MPLLLVGSESGRVRDAQEFYDRWEQAINARAFAPLKEIAHPDVELHPLATVRTESYRGRDGMREWLHDTRRCKSVRLSGTVVEASEDRMLVTGTLSLSTIRGPLPDRDVCWVLLLRDGRVLSDSAFPTMDEARSAYERGY